jgi:opacity protein-like surface antigen
MHHRVLRLAVVPLALTLAASGASAQRRGHAAPARSGSAPFTFGVAGGLSVPTGDLGDAVGTGFHLEGLASHRLTSAPITLRGELAFHAFGSQEVSAGGNTTSVDAHTLAIVMNGVYDLRTNLRARPYVIGGLGAYDVTGTVKINGQGGSDSDWKLGANVGAGARFAVGGMRSFVEVRYHIVDQASYLPISFGVWF